MADNTTAPSDEEAVILPKLLRERQIFMLTLAMSFYKISLLPPQAVPLPRQRKAKKRRLIPSFLSSENVSLTVC